MNVGAHYVAAAAYGMATFVRCCCEQREAGRGGERREVSVVCIYPIAVML